MGITFKEIKSEVEHLEEADLSQQGQVDPKIYMSQFLSRLFAARNAAHFAHWMTTSYAQHIALQTFYETILSLADTLAESFIGRYGKFEGFPNVKESATDPLIVVGNLTKWIDANRSALTENSEIQNQIDEIVTLCNQTAYRLRELR